MTSLAFCLTKPAAPQLPTPPQPARPVPARGRRKGPQMSKRGSKTAYPGIWEVEAGRKYKLLVTATCNGKRLYREGHIDGTLNDARRQQLTLEDELDREI